MTQDQAPIPPRPAKRWAYHAIEVRTKFNSGMPTQLDQLNAAGADGWEAVGMTTSSGNNFQVLLKKAY